MVLDVYDIRKLPEDGAIVEETLEIEWLNAHLNDVPAETAELALQASAPGQARFELNRINHSDVAHTIVRVRGKASAHLSSRCVRCLEPIEFSVESAVDLTLFPVGYEPKDEAQNGESAPARKVRVEISRQALDEGTYSEDQIDLPEIVREAILLDVAMNPCCEDTTACEQRTEQLIAAGGSTPYEEAKVDPRWAALLKIKLESG